MNVTINITTTPTALPAGVIAGLLALSITDAAGKAVNDANGQALNTQQVNGNTATFPGVLAGDYVASAVRLDTNGTPIGIAVTQTFTVQADGGNAPVADPSTGTSPVTGISPASSSYEAPQTITITVV